MPKYYVVIDINVVVSALYDKDEKSNTNKILKLISNKIVIPLYSSEIIKEYKNVLSRKEFSFNKYDVDSIINIIKK